VRVAKLPSPLAARTKAYIVNSGHLAKTDSTQRRPEIGDRPIDLLPFGPHDSQERATRSVPSMGASCSSSAAQAVASVARVLRLISWHSMILGVLNGQVCCRPPLGVNDPVLEDVPGHFWPEPSSLNHIPRSCQTF
jgi:hypothetical protein